MRHSGCGDSEKPGEPQWAMVQRVGRALPLPLTIEAVQARPGGHAGGSDQLGRGFGDGQQLHSQRCGLQKVEHTRAMKEGKWSPPEKHKRDRLPPSLTQRNTISEPEHNAVSKT